MKRNTAFTLILFLLFGCREGVKEQEHSVQLDRVNMAISYFKKKKSEVSLDSAAFYLQEARELLGSESNTYLAMNKAYLKLKESKADKVNNDVKVIKSDPVEKKVEPSMTNEEKKFQVLSKRLARQGKDICRLYLQWEGIERANYKRADRAFPNFGKSHSDYYSELSMKSGNTFKATHNLSNEDLGILVYQGLYSCK